MKRASAREPISSSLVKISSGSTERARVQEPSQMPARGRGIPNYLFIASHVEQIPPPPPWTGGDAAFVYVTANRCLWPTFPHLVQRPNVGKLFTSFAYQCGRCSHTLETWLRHDEKLRHLVESNVTLGEQIMRRSILDANVLVCTRF